MARHDACWWTERVAELEATGDPALVARRHGVTVKHLKWWRWKLRTTTPGNAARRVPRARKRRAEPRLLPVVLAPAVGASTSELDAAIIIETTRGRISIRGPLSAEQLGTVVAELVRGC